MSPDRTSPGWARFGEYLDRLTRQKYTQDQLAEMLTDVTTRGRPYKQPEVSRHLQGRSLTPEAVRDYVLALELDVDEVIAAIFGEDFTDPSLDAETSQHLRRQKQMLRELVTQRRGSESPVDADNNNKADSP